MLWCPLLSREAWTSIVLLLLFDATCIGASRRAEQDERGLDRAIAAAPALADRALSESRRALLEIAFDAASAIPEMPHIKSKLRAQDAVVAACLELDQALRASRYIERVQGWRRGVLHADLAHWCAVHGAPAVALEHIERAKQFEESPIGNPAGQEWRRDRVRARIARAYLALGRVADAEASATGLVESELGIVLGARAAVVKAEELEPELAALDGAIASGSFESMQAGLEACAALYERFFADVPKREQLEARIAGGRRGLPSEIRLQLHFRLVRAALAHADAPKARALLAKAQVIADEAKWRTEDRLRVYAELAALRYRAGDSVLARQDLDALFAQYEREQERIVDIYRARAVRSIAEAYAEEGDAAAAVAAFAHAVEAGLANRNSLPRAEDLIETCTSMARSGIEPEAAALERLRGIAKNLGETW